jgi:F5/8 type C domain/PQQ-like domain
VRIITPTRWRTVTLCVVIIALLNARSARAVNVLTQHNDNARTGANLSETVLTTTNVNSAQFGKLWSYPVNGQVYAQPLVAQGVTIGGVARNVVYVATMHNTVYAFNADSSSGTPLWSVNLGPSVALPSSTLGTSGGCNPYQDIQGEIGILSTPVIDLAGGTLYVEAKTLESGAYIDRLHALDTTTGAEKMGGPVAIGASVSGTAGARALNGLRANQRAGLLLSGGRVYVGFASYCDAGPYYGWLLGYSASNLTQAPLVYTPVQDGSQAGIWMSGEGPSADASGNVYVITGNGSFNGNTAGGRNLGNSIIKLTSTLGVLDWFTPYNQSSLNASDLDLGSAGPLLLPGSSLIVSGGKEGKIYVVNANSMGHYQSGSDSQIVQSFMSSGTHLHGSPVYWMGPSGALVYVGAESDYIKGYRLTSGLFATSPFTQTSFTSPRNAMPGSILAVSANGSAQDSGILWANMTISQDANHATVPGLLRAFDASNLLIELWNSQQNSARDGLGNHAKYCPPTIANGKVFMATFSKQVVVYGLLAAGTPTATATATRTPTPTAAGRATATPTATATATATARATATPTTAATTLLSRAHPVAVSSTENTGTPGSAAVDGDTTTRWSSAFSDPQWIYVDLGATHTVSRVVLNWETAYGKAFQIQTSTDAVTWTTIYQTTTGAGGINDVAVSGSGRYVRMYGTARGTAWGYSLWELEVYGT